MSDGTSRLEATAEAIVFAHEPDASPVPMSGEAIELERTASLVSVALARPAAMPQRLEARLAAAGLAFCAEQRQRLDRTPPGFTTTLPGRTQLAGRKNEWPWLLAVAAAALAAIAWWPALPPPSVREVRSDVLANDPTIVQLPWQAGPSPLRGEVQGDVVWSHARQDGWMTLRGLPKLDPNRAYQLWIVDGNREGAPVDGGVFTVANPSREEIIKIQAKLPIGRAKAFVVTVEDKAGVVVSQKEHIVAIASL